MITDNSDNQKKGGRCVGFGPLLEVIQDPLHHRRVLDAGDHFDVANTRLAGLFIKLENSFETLGPSHDGARWTGDDMNKQ